MGVDFETLYAVESTLIFLAIIPALWISGRIILQNPISENRSIQLFLWLVLGGFFIIALVDLISLLRDVISLAIPSDQSANVFPLFLGTTSLQVYTAIVVVMGIIIYSFAIYYGQKLILKDGFPAIKRLTLSPLEQWFIVLGLAGLFSHMIRGIVLNFIWLSWPMPTGISSEGYIGSFISWIVGFLVLAIVIVFMNGKLESKEQ